MGNANKKQIEILKKRKEQLKKLEETKKQTTKKLTDFFSKDQMVSHGEVNAENTEATSVWNTPFAKKQSLSSLPEDQAKNKAKELVEMVEKESKQGKRDQETKVENGKFYISCANLKAKKSSITPDPSSGYNSVHVKRVIQTEKIIADLYKEHRKTKKTDEKAKKLGSDNKQIKDSLIQKAKKSR